MQIQLANAFEAQAKLAFVFMLSEKNHMSIIFLLFETSSSCEPLFWLQSRSRAAGSDSKAASGENEMRGHEEDEGGPVFISVTQSQTQQQKA